MDLMAAQTKDGKKAVVDVLEDGRDEEDLSR